MNNYMIPSNAEFVEGVAKAIAHQRMFQDAADDLHDSVGVNLEENESMVKAFDEMFEIFWAASPDEISNDEKISYRMDATAAIRAINLKLITTPS